MGSENIRESVLGEKMVPHMRLLKEGKISVGGIENKGVSEDKGPILIDFYSQCLRS